MFDFMNIIDNFFFHKSKLVCNLINCIKKENLIKF